MKTKKLKTVLFLIILQLLLSKPLQATTYQTIYMDSVADYSIVYYCSDVDSLRFIPMQGMNNVNWFNQSFNDTIHTDTLYVVAKIEGYLRCYEKGHPAKYIALEPIKYSFTDNTVYATCNTPTPLSINSNGYNLSVNTISWNPIEGLDNPLSATPVLLTTTNRKYTVSITTIEGCKYTTNVNVILRTKDSPSICLITVNNNNKNVIYWEKPSTNGIDSFYIYRETNVSNQYKQIASISYNSINKYIDETSLPNVQSYRYKISIKDSCGFESSKSNFHKTMHLSINKGQENTWNLIWEPYQGFYISTYYIYRGTNAGNLQLIGTATESSTQYTDFSAPAGYVYYQVEVVSADNCITGNTKSALETINSSRSNIASNNSTGINYSISGDKQFSIYPTFVENNLTITSQILAGKKTIAQLYSVEGKVVQSIFVNSGITKMDVSGVAKGVYMLRINSGNAIYSYKILKK